jgi:hypothetical protein
LDLPALQNNNLVHNLCNTSGFATVWGADNPDATSYVGHVTHVCSTTWLDGYGAPVQTWHTFVSCVSAILYKSWWDVHLSWTVWEGDSRIHLDTIFVFPIRWHSCAHLEVVLV